MIYIYRMKNRERTQFLIFYVIKAMMEVDKHSNTDIFILLVSNILYFISLLIIIRVILHAKTN